MALPDVFSKHGNYQDALIASFEDMLRQTLTRARNQVSGYLRSQLEVDDANRIRPISRNVSIVRRLGTQYSKALSKSGYDALIHAFVSQFPGQFPYMNQVLDHISDSLRTPLPPVDINPRAIDPAVKRQLVALSSIKSILTGAVNQSMLRTLFSLGGLTVDDLTSVLASKVDATVPQARTLAATSMSTFYRSLVNQSFEEVAKSSPDVVLLYRYDGPSDKLTRPFCREQLARKRPITRAQIDALDNGQIPDVFLTCGGFNCRHQWVIDDYRPSRIAVMPGPRYQDVPASYRREFTSLKNVLGDRLELFDPESRASKRHILDLNLLNEETIRRLADAGVKIKVGNRPVTQFPEMEIGSGEPARGWPSMTWDDVPGGYDPDRKILAIGAGVHGSDSIAVHEAMHAVDDVAELLPDPFVQVKYDQFFATLDPYAQQPGRAGQEEFLSESVAEAANLQRRNPSTAFQKFVEKYDREWASWIFRKFLKAFL